jgi:enamine deaminase RidA (YjgF/YER057c/UK114 family)
MIARLGVGPRMSEAVIHGSTVYLAGQVGEGADVTEQTKSVLAEIDSALALAGTDKSKLLSATVYLTDMSKFAEMNAVWDAWVTPGQTPCRACVEAKLALPKFLVEIMVVAAK